MSDEADKEAVTAALDEIQKILVALGFTPEPPVAEAPAAGEQEAALLASAVRNLEQMGFDPSTIKAIERAVLDEKPAVMPEIELVAPPDWQKGYESGFATGIRWGMKIGQELRDALTAPLEKTVRELNHERREAADKPHICQCRKQEQ